MSKNINTTIEGNQLVIRMDVSAKALADARPSSSGKTRIVASTEGNIKIDTPNGVVTVGINAYIPA